MAYRRGTLIFNGVDLYETYGILVERVEDDLLPALRERKVVVPGRSGAYDFGAQYYDERLLTLPSGSTRQLTRGEVREVSYALSKKGRIVLWDEPDKYYLGRIYDATDLERVLRTMRKYTLHFLCEPFAYGATVQVDFHGPVWSASYAGTQETPTRLQITNAGSITANGIQITITEKRENY